MIFQNAKENYVEQFEQSKESLLFDELYANWETIKSPSKKTDIAQYKDKLSEVINGINDLIDKNYIQRPIITMPQYKEKLSPPEVTGYTINWAAPSRIISKTSKIDNFNLQELQTLYEIISENFFPTEEQIETAEVPESQFYKNVRSSVGEGLFIGAAVSLGVAGLHNIIDGEKFIDSFSKYGPSLGTAFFITKAYFSLQGKSKKLETRFNNYR